MIRRKTNAERAAASRKIEWLTSPLEHFCEKAGEAVGVALGLCCTVLLLPAIIYVHFTWKRGGE